jgi:hypothetical protein
MDIRGWLNGPKGLNKTTTKSPNVAKKHSKQLESDSDEEQAVTSKKVSNKENRKKEIKKEVDPKSFFTKKKTPAKEKVEATAEG